MRRDELRWGAASGRDALTIARRVNGRLRLTMLGHHVRFFSAFTVLAALAVLMLTGALHLYEIANTLAAATLLYNPTARSAFALVGWFPAKFYGAKFDNATDDTTSNQGAVDACATAGGGTVAMPRGTSLTTISMQDVSGVVLQGSGRNSTILRGPNTTNPVVVNIFSNAFSGSVKRCSVRDLQITYHGSSTNTTGLRIWNALWFDVKDCLILANGTALSIQGSGNGNVTDVEAYLQQTAGNAAVDIGDGGGTLTSPGPVHFSGGQYSALGNGHPALKIGAVSATKGSFSMVFDACTFNSNGAGMTAVVTVDGTYTSVTFNGCHSESCYNTTANTGVDFLIGATAKAGSVTFINPIHWGHGDGTRYQQYAIKVVACKNLSCTGGFWSKLTATNGYSGGIFRFEAGYPAAGDVISIRANSKDTVTAPLYSDGNSTPLLSTSWTGSFEYPRLQIANVQVIGERKRLLAQRTAAIDETLADRRSASAATPLGVSGRLTLLGQVLLPAEVPVTNIVVLSGSTAMVTPSNQWTTLIKVSDLSIIAKSADDTTNAWATQVEKAFAITGGPITQTSDVLAYIGLVIVAATMPTVVGVTDVPSLAALAPAVGGLSTSGLTNPASLTSVNAPTVTGSRGYAYIS